MRSIVVCLELIPSDRIPEKNNWTILLLFVVIAISCAGTFQRNSRNIGLLYCVCHSSSYTFQQIRKMQRYLKCFYFFSILKRIRYIWTTRYDKYTNMYWLLHIVFIHTYYIWSIQWKFQSFRVNLFLTCTFCWCKNQTLIYSFFFKRSHICHCNINFHMPYKKSDISSVYSEGCKQSIKFSVFLCHRYI